jgi:hypothetical protein
VPPSFGRRHTVEHPIVGRGAPQEVFLLETPQHGVARRGVDPEEAAQLSLSQVMSRKFAVFLVDDVHATIHAASDSRHMPFLEQRLCLPTSRRSPWIFRPF